MFRRKTSAKASALTGNESFSATSEVEIAWLLSHRPFPTERLRENQNCFALRVNSCIPLPPIASRLRCYQDEGGAKPQTNASSIARDQMEFEKRSQIALRNALGFCGCDASGREEIFSFCDPVSLNFNSLILECPSCSEVLLYHPQEATQFSVA